MWKKELNQVNQERKYNLATIYSFSMNRTFEITKNSNSSKFSVLTCRGFFCLMISTMSSKSISKFNNRDKDGILNPSHKLRSSFELLKSFSGITLLFSGKLLVLCFFNVRQCRRQAFTKKKWKPFENSSRRTFKAFRMSWILQNQTNPAKVHDTNFN